MAAIKIILASLENALKSGDYNDFLALVSEDSKCLKNRFGVANATLLHHLCSINLSGLKEHDPDSILDLEAKYRFMFDELIKKFKQEINLNLQDKQGDTPLHCAIRSCNEVAVNILLQHSDVLLCLPNQEGHIPLELAREMKLTAIIDAISGILSYSSDGSRSASLQTSGSEEMAGIKMYQKMLKQNVINLGAMKPVSVMPFAYDAIESVIYFNNHAIKARFYGCFKKMSRDEVLFPMINMMGLCAIRGTFSHAASLTLFDGFQSLTKIPNTNESTPEIEKKLGKKFKIICVDAPNTNEIKLFSGNLQGLYTNKNTVYVAIQGLEPKQILALICHESSHFVMNTLFNNNCNPFPRNQDHNPLEEHFSRIVKITFNDLDKIHNLLEDMDEYAAFKIIENVFTEYKEREWALELIVRVPQIIVLLGQEKGYKWLEKHTPDLFEFYKNEINPRMMKYLFDHKVEDYLSGITPPAEIKTYTSSLG